MRYKGACPINAPSGYTVKIYFWKISSYFVSLCAVCLPSKGYIFGHACSKNLPSAIKKASEEVVTNIIVADSQRDERAKIDRIVPDEISSFSNYWRSSGDDRVFSLLDDVNTRSLGELRVPDQVYYSEVPIPLSLRSYVGSLVCMRVISPKAQQLFFEEWSEKVVNPIIFSQFTLPTYPHIIA